jgi:hypothetical protein
MRESVNSGKQQLAFDISPLSGAETGRCIVCEHNRAFLARLWNNAAVIIFSVSGRPCG